MLVTVCAIAGAAIGALAGAAIRSTKRGEKIENNLRETAQGIVEIVERKKSKELTQNETLKQITQEK